jgi:hypothetical protein
MKLHYGWYCLRFFFEWFSFSLQIIIPQIFHILGLLSPLKYAIGRTCRHVITTSVHEWSFASFLPALVLVQDKKVGLWLNLFVAEKYLRIPVRKNT